MLLATSVAVTKSLARRGRTASSRTANAASSVRAMSNLAAYDDYGKNVFSGTVADEYLRKHGSSGDILKDPNWVNTDADAVANAVFDW